MQTSPRDTLEDLLPTLLLNNIHNISQTQFQSQCFRCECKRYMGQKPSFAGQNVILIVSSLVLPCLIQTNTIAARLLERRPPSTHSLRLDLDTDASCNLPSSDLAQDSFESMVAFTAWSATPLNSRGNQMTGSKVSRMGLRSRAKHRANKLTMRANIGSAVVFVSAARPLTRLYIS